MTICHGAKLGFWDAFGTLLGRLDDDELIPEPGILLFRKPGTQLCRNMGILLCRNPGILLCRLWLVWGWRWVLRAGWRDAGLEGPHPKRNPGRVPLAAVPPGVRGTLPRSDAEAVPGEGRCADPEGCAGTLRPSTREGCACCGQQEAQVQTICFGGRTA